ncbi:MAG: metallophosphoesterase [Ruminococcaceae bacterium]|nr:metallophosphoesterase [Oscillospiraceae bacterium]
MRRTRVQKRKGRFLRWVIAAVLLLSLLMADSALRPVVTHYAPVSDALPAAFDGFRIVQLSDVHGVSFGTDNARLLELTAQAEPDIIALTGDLADSRTDLKITEQLLCGLSAIAPVYYVSGNHEWSEGLIAPLCEMFERTGVSYLRNEFAVLSRDGAEIVLAGVEDPNGWRDMPRPDAVADEIRAQRPEDYVLLLAHRNDWTEQYPDLPVELILCGHAHGGLVRIPGVGGVFGTKRELFPEHTEGVFRSGSYSMVVSRGLGGGAPVPRVLNNPEIVCITLRCA